MIKSYSKNKTFNHNNWLKNKGNVALSILDEYGISIYLGVKGEICYSVSPTEKYESTKDFKSLEDLFKNITGEDIDLWLFIRKKRY